MTTGSVEAGAVVIAAPTGPRRGARTAVIGDRQGEVRLVAGFGLTAQPTVFGCEPQFGLAVDVEGQRGLCRRTFGLYPYPHVVAAGGDIARRLHLHLQLFGLAGIDG